MQIDLLTRNKMNSFTSYSSIQPSGKCLKIVYFYVNYEINWSRLAEIVKQNGRKCHVGQIHLGKKNY